MIEMNPNATEMSLSEKARQHLDRGETSSAMECYRQIHDPESLDEIEARNMLIEAHANLSRKHLLDSLENFEEALVMGTEVQRRQALDGIATVADMRSRLNRLTPKLKKALKEILGKRTPSGMAIVSERDNVVLVSKDAFQRLPGHLAKASRMSRLPQHLQDQPLPFPVEKCLPYADEDDVKFILEVAEALSKLQKSEPDDAQIEHFNGVPAAQE
jgi:hypothetical protein